MAEHRAWRHRGYLPHLDAGATVQFVTFRLADSLPRDVYEACLAAAEDRIELHHRMEAMIDAGRGACLLRDASNAAVVQTALEHFDGERYRLIAVEENPVKAGLAARPCDWPFSSAAGR